MRSQLISLKISWEQKKLLFQNPTEKKYVPRNIQNFFLIFNKALIKSDKDLDSLTNGCTVKIKKEKKEKKEKKDKKETPKHPISPVEKRSSTEMNIGLNFLNRSPRSRFSFHAKSLQAQNKIFGISLASLVSQDILFALKSQDFRSKENAQAPKIRIHRPGFHQS
jgi:hypothetical protein